jgi:hypothetical protein
VLNRELFTTLPLSDQQLAQLFKLLRSVRFAAGDFVE